MITFNVIQCQYANVHEDLQRYKEIIPGFILIQNISCIWWFGGFGELERFPSSCDLSSCGGWHGTARQLSHIELFYSEALYSFDLWVVSVVGRPSSSQHTARFWSHNQQFNIKLGDTVHNNSYWKNTRHKGFLISILASSPNMTPHKPLAVPQFMLLCSCASSEEPDSEPRKLSHRLKRRSWSRTIHVWIQIGWQPLSVQRRRRRWRRRRTAVVVFIGSFEILLAIGLTTHNSDWPLMHSNCSPTRWTTKNTPFLLLYLAVLWLCLIRIGPYAYAMYVPLHIFVAPLFHWRRAVRTFAFFIYRRLSILVVVQYVLFCIRKAYFNSGVGCWSCGRP